MTKKVYVISKTREYDGFFKLDKIVFQHEKFNGEMSEEITRLNFDRGDAVAVLLYDAEKDSVILVNQFRYPAYVNGGPGWLLEIVAGIIDNDRDAESVARSELMEEAGYKVDSLEFISKFYLSPGGSSERIYLYIAYAHRKVASGGGKKGEHEDIQVVELPLEKALNMIATGEICDAKTIIALQWLKLRKVLDKNLSKNCHVKQSEASQRRDSSLRSE